MMTRNLRSSWGKVQLKGIERGDQYCLILHGLYPVTPGNAKFSNGEMKLLYGSGITCLQIS